MKVRKREWETSKGEPREAYYADCREGGKDYGSKGGFKRKKDAEAYLEEVRHRMRIGVHVPDRATVTFGEACQAWLDHCERRWRTVNPDGSRGLAGGTLNLYQGTAERNVLP